MGDLFFSILTQPMINALTALYHAIPDLGIGIILLTLVIKIILFPLNWKSIKAQKQMKDIQQKLENEFKPRRDKLVALEDKLKKAALRL